MNEDRHDVARCCLILASYSPLISTACSAGLWYVMSLRWCFRMLACTLVCVLSFAQLNEYKVLQSIGGKCFTKNRVLNCILLLLVSKISSEQNPL